MNLSCLILALLLSLSCMGQNSFDERNFKFEKCASDLFELLKLENYSSLGQYIPTLAEHDGPCFGLLTRYSEQQERDFSKKFYDSFKIAHDSINLWIHERLEIKTLGIEAHWVRVECKDRIEKDSSKVYISSIIVDGGLSTYSELIFYLNEVNGECKLYWPFIESKELKIIKRASTREFIEK